MVTTAPNRIRKWSPTLLLTGRYPGCLRRSDGMRNFLDSMAVDDGEATGCVYRLQGQTVVSKNGVFSTFKHDHRP
jgi:hypothetical protein